MSDILGMSILARGTLGDVALANVYTCPAGKSATIRSMVVTNRSGGDRNYYVVLRSADVVPVDVYMSFKEAVPSHDTESFMEVFPMEAGESFLAWASAADSMDFVLLGSLSDITASS